jgi:hypothetical protein
MFNDSIKTKLDIFDTTLRATTPIHSGVLVAIRLIEKEINSAMACERWDEAGRLAKLRSNLIAHIVPNPEAYI